MNIAFIPARCGSKSIPLKNIKKFCGKPLIYWVLKALEESSIISKIYVSTDCKDIKNVVESFKFEKTQVFKRSKATSSDNATTESAMLEFIDKVGLDDDDMFFLVQLTSPFTQSIDFERALEKLKIEKADSLLTCARIKKFLWSDYGTPLNYDYKQRPRRQEFNGILVENGAFYINKVRNIREHKNRLSGNIAIYEMPSYTAIELDEEEDWIIAEQLMYKYRLKNNNSLSRVKIFISDVDGTLTDAGMYYGINGEELKKFNTYDGMAFELLRKAGIKVAIISSENSKIVEVRAKKLKVDYLYLGIKDKLEIIEKICDKEGIPMEQVAYIGDDINCKDALVNVGVAACPANAVDEIKKIPNIIKLSKKGGEGAVREFAEKILDNVKLIE